MLFGSLAGNQSFSPNKAVNAALYLPIYFAGTVMFIKSRLYFLLFSPQNVAYAIFGLLAVVSSAWAISPRASFVDGTQLALTIVAGFGFAACLTMGNALKTLSWTLIFVLATCVIYVVFIPSLGLMSGQENSGLRGLPQGIFSHKNRYAELSVIGGFVALVAGGERPTIERLVLLALALTGLYLAESAAKSASFIAATTVWLTWLFFAKSANARAIWFGFLALAFAFCLLVLPVVFEQITTVIGKDLTLSGRTLIWHHSSIVAWQRPFFGYGSASIWQSFLGFVDTFQNYQPPHSHNLYLETFLRFGVFGLLLIMACLIGGMVHLVTSGPFNAVSKLFFLLFIAHLIRSPVEVVLFRDNQIGFLLWLIFLGLSQRISKSQQDAKESL